LTATFANFKFCPALTENLRAANFTTPTPIQEAAIPLVLEGKDVLAAAQTGTGKTAAYVLPLAEKILKKKLPCTAKSAKALILTPTRELAAQVLETIELLCGGTKIQAAAVFGGVSIGPQIRKLARGVDFLVATPGRLLDLVQQNAVRLDSTGVLVLDEADRMLDMGFIHDMKRIVRLLPEERQTLLFSATFSAEIRGLAASFLKNPADVEIARNQDAALVRQTLYRMPKASKREALRDLIVDNRWEQVLVFTRTKHGADRLCKQLAKDGLEAMAIHGDKTQGARTRALQAFKDRTLPILVATDIAARGLDIEKLPQIVNYDLPQQAEDYVHRIGRTGRAGMSGEAISLVSGEERKQLREIERFIKKALPLSDFPGYDYSVHPDEEPEDKPKTASRPPRKKRGEEQNSHPKSKTHFKSKATMKPRQKTSGGAAQEKRFRSRSSKTTSKS
jgi:ATP-dependent RNA helicase RhlE